MDQHYQCDPFKNSQKLQKGFITDKSFLTVKVD